MLRILIVSLVAGLMACSPLSDSAASGPWDQVTVVTSAGAHTFHVDIADDPDEQRRGLMFRRELAEDAGMLFLYERQQPLSYWMRNTYISLDIIYIDQEGRIVSIAERTTPLSERSIPSAGPAIAVLEVLAGTSARLGFTPGDEVRHPFFDGIATSE